MFPATLARDHGHIRRILIVALATLMLFATLAIANTTPAEAHTPYVNADCREWSVTLVSYGGSTDTLKNTVQVWEVIDGDDIVLVDTAFGSSFSDSGTWDPTVDHTLRVKVVAIHSSYSFDDTWESTACEEPPDPRLTLVKTVEGGGPLGVSDFPLFIDSVPAISGTAYTLEPGDYTASETTNADYAAGVWGGACAADGSVTLSAGDDVTCTITNTYQPPELATLTLVKTVEGGTLAADDFPVFLNLNGEPTGRVAWGTTYPLPDGAYTAWEIVQDDYTTEGWGGDCDAGGNVTLVAGNNYTCTITNTYVPPFVPNPAIHIEKATNGFDADNPPGPSVVVGSTVTWTYVVTNTGNVPLANVTVTDDQAGVTPVYQGGDTNTNNLLDLTETWTYQATGTAVAGQYANIGTVTGFYPQGEEQVDDNDPSHYVGYVPTVDEPAIQIEKATNGVDADTPAEGLPLEVGSNVTWTYVVTNTGDVTLTNVKVTDDKLGDISCPKNTLAAGESMTCTASGTAELVQYANLGTVTGSYGVVTVTDTDPSHYSGVAVGGTAQLGDTVWLDANNNGVQDNGEVGYNGAKVILKDGDGNVVGTLTTATGAWVGFYKFVGLDAGTYTAMLDLSTIGNYGVTTANSFTVTLAEGDDYLDADFGLYQAPPTTTVPPEETLPVTGVETEGMAILGLGLLLLGTLTILATRKRPTTD